MAVWEPDTLRLANHRRAILQTTVPTFVVELSMGGPFVLPHADLRVRGEGRLWRKENLLNLLEKVVPEHFDHLIWNDSGVALQEPRLEDLVENALRHHAFIQPFSTCDWIGPGGGVEIIWNPWCKGGEDKSQGLVWATKRSTWRELGGLWAGDILDSTELERVLIGNSSSAEAHAWLSQIPPSTLGYCPGHAVHYWHKITKRISFMDRLAVMDKLGYDRTKDLTTNSQGVIEILNPAVAKYAASYLGRVYA